MSCVRDFRAFDDGENAFVARPVNWGLAAVVGTVQAAVAWAWRVLLPAHRLSRTTNGLF